MSLKHTSMIDLQYNVRNVIDSVFLFKERSQSV